MNRPMRVLMVSAEVESFARTGGLGDMVAALSLALAKLGLDVVVVTPRYGITRVPPNARQWPERVDARWGWGPSDVSHATVLECEESFEGGGRRRVCLLDVPELFDRTGIYADARGEFADNDRRFAVLSRGALEVGTRAWEGGPDVLHAHDWHTAFAVVYAKLVMGERWAKLPAVFTIHNLAFQGVYGESTLDRTHLPRSAFRPEVLWHDGAVNLMKGATALADRITTVSPTYAREILTAAGGAGLDLHMRAHAHRLVGILNGIDTDSADPHTDPVLARRYDVTSFEVGRAACKAVLLQSVGLTDSDGPLFGCVARLTWQKGIDLVLPFVDAIVARGGRLLVVGQGETELEHRFVDAAARHPGKVVTKIAFDPPLSRRVFAGSDFFLAPSRFEPCGLTQLYAMRYGALPIVTNVGGLHDTVEPIADVGSARERGVGIVAPRADEASLRIAFEAAFELYRDRPSVARAVARAMRKDVSWWGPARAYVALYEDVLGG
ncbi:Glycogen synthase, ADP-glucose transglucosylase [Labilithrix luteola]|uniref:Glycogen synthase n=1 Tax=Labilithrix luteola TaxID=1391654 RepID=A0A0K1QDL3_9BACT|nr:glycogen synthase [Labilithrix luteola]AKV03525.1 Glycogen synthase, ADP-glucose transglucosylase [Labilithrix luteola]